MRLIPDQGAEIPHASWLKYQNIKKQCQQYCNKFNKVFKNDLYQKYKKYFIKKLLTEMMKQTFKKKPMYA